MDYVHVANFFLNIIISQRWGTKEFFAPEVINAAYGPQADVWALGELQFIVVF